jgi:hypothetical protein
MNEISTRAQNFIRDPGMMLRTLTADDKARANTDYKRSASYIVSYDDFNHHEYYWNGKTNELFKIWNIIQKW